MKKEGEGRNSVCLQDLRKGLCSSGLIKPQHKVLPCSTGGWRAVVQMKSTSLTSLGPECLPGSHKGPSQSGVKSPWKCPGEKGTLLKAAVAASDASASLAVGTAVAWFQDPVSACSICQAEAHPHFFPSFPRTEVAFLRVLLKLKG